MIKSRLPAGRCFPKMHMLLLSSSVTREEWHTILAFFFLFLHHVGVLLVVLPGVHGKCSGRHARGPDQQQSHRELQQRGAATSASTCTAATPQSAAAAAATAAISAQTFSPDQQHPQPTQQPTSHSFSCPLSTHAQHTHFVNFQLPVSVHTSPDTQFGTGSGLGPEQSRHDGYQQCQPDGWLRPGRTPHSAKHNGRAYFRLHACPIRSGGSVGGLGSEQQHPVQRFIRKQHFDPHIRLQWSHHQRGRDGSGLTGNQSGPQFSKREHSGVGSRAKHSPQCLSGATQFCQQYAWSSGHAGKQWRERGRCRRSRGKCCPC